MSTTTDDAVATDDAAASDDDDERTTPESPDPSDTATEDVAADEDSEDSEKRGSPLSDDAPPSTRSRRTLLLRGALAAVILALIAGAGVLGWKFYEQRSVVQAGEQAQAAAVAYAQVLTSIDSNKVDENFNQVLDGATGEFKDMYSQSSIQLRQLLIDNKASAHGVVVESAVQSASPDKVVVLLFVDQSVSNTAVPDPRIDRSRIKMTMELVDGRWRASKVELP